MMPFIIKPSVRTFWVKAATVATVTVIALTSCASGPDTITESRGALSEGRLLSAESPDGHQLREVPAEEAPTVELKVSEDSSSGWNVHVASEEFDFAPERLGEVNPQEGHAHLFLDGKKIARLYGPWYHLSGSAVPAGEHELSVMLNANDHTAWAVDGQPVEASAMITGTGEAGHSHDKGAHDGGHKPAAETPDASAPGDAPAFTVTGAEVEGPKQISANVGEELIFTVQADIADEVHVHGYDATVPVEPGETVTVQLQADIPGVFEVELEGSGLLLTQLRVSP